MAMFLFGIIMMRLVSSSHEIDVFSSGIFQQADILSVIHTVNINRHDF